MELLLMVACVSLFGLAVTAIAFGAASGAGQPAPETPPVREPEVFAAPARFFSEAAAPAFTPKVPIEALLLQIESHVRLEQAAAESFLVSPTAALLHGRTASPFVN